MRRKAADLARRLALALGLLVVAGTVRAAPITWSFSGQVELVAYGSLAEPSLATALIDRGVEVGAPMSGWIRFESTTPNERPPGCCAAYRNAIDGAHVEIGEYVLDLRADGNPDYFARDIFVSSVDGDSVWFSEVDMQHDIPLALRWILMSLELSGAEAGTFDPSLLPVDPPALGALQPYGANPSPLGFGSDLYVSVAVEPGQYATVRASLSRLERVPEPRSPLLILASLGALALVRRRRSS